MGCRLLRQSTTVTIDMGPALDRTNAYDEETGLSPTVYLSKAGAAQAARNSATAITHDARGYYRVELNTTDTGTLGMLRALFHDSATHLPVWEYFMVIPSNVYDSLVAGSDNLEVDAILWRGTQPNTLQSGRVDAYVGAKASGVGLSTQEVTDLVAMLVTSGLIVARSTIASLSSQTVFRLAAGSADNDAYNDCQAVIIDASTAAQRAVVDINDYVGADLEITLAAAPAFTIATSDIVVIVPRGLTRAQAQAAALAAVQAYDPPTNAEMEARTIAAANYATASALDAVDNFVDTEVAAILALLQDGTVGLAAIEALVDELESRLTSARAGYLDNLSAGAVAQASALATADGKLDSILEDTGTTLPATLSSMDDKLDTIDNFLDTEIASIISSLSTIAGYLDTEIAAILADTNELQTDWANGGRLDLLIDAIKAVTDALPDAGALTSKANEATLTSTGRGDPSALAGSLGSSLSLAAKIDWIFAAILRAGEFNRTTGEQIIQNAAGTPIAKAVAADDGTTTERSAYGAP